ncbi:MAG: hypothetical protein IJV27_08000, partial [Prevotella sp.]|nr:hypothetical protein [Prevotella sp.]
RRFINKIYGNKKTWEKLSVAYPSHQAFALPFYRDKQLSQPTPMRIIKIGNRERLPSLSHLRI